jgi:nicotinamide mononucleotide adenylyltransferase
MEFLAYTQKGISMILYVIIGVLVLVVVVLILKVTKRNLRGTKRNVDVAPKEAEIENVNEIIIGTSENRPYATLTMLPKDFRPEQNAKNTQITGKALESLAPAIQIAPSLLTAASTYGSKYMKVVVDGTLARAADGNGYRGFVRDATTGKIVNHSRFYDTSLKELVSLTAGFQILTVVVGQAHLAAINKKLTTIQEGVKSILFMLENQRQAKIKAICQHLSEYNMAVSNGELSEPYRVNIEQIDLELKSLVIELENEIAQKSEKLRTYQDKEKLGCADLHKELVDTSLQIGVLVKQLFISIECRVMACQLTCYFPNSKTISEIRLREIRSDIDRITSNEGVLKRAGDVVFSRVDDIDSRFNKNATIEQRRQEVRNKWWSIEANVSEYKNAIRTDLSASYSLLQVTGKPVEVLVKIEDGKAQEAMLLSN